MTIKRNNQNFGSDAEYISSFSTVLDKYNGIIQDYQDAHPVTTENILKYLESKNKDIKEISDEDIKTRVINDYKSQIYDHALHLRRQYVVDNWNNAETSLPKDLTWCVCYTDLGHIITSFYDSSKNKWSHHIENTKMTGRTYNNVLYWTYLTFDKLPNVLNNVSYVNFPEHRYVNDEKGKCVNIMPNDICVFKFRHPFYHEEYPLQGVFYKYSKFLSLNEDKRNDVISIELVTIDYDDSENNVIQAKLLDDKLSVLEKCINSIEENNNEKRHIDFKPDTYSKFSKTISEHYNELKDYVMKLSDCVDMTENDKCQLLDILEIVAFKRRTGKTTRIINDIVDKFYQCPMETPILIKDHESLVDTTQYLISAINDKLGNSNVKYSIYRDPFNNEWYLKRLSETQYESACNSLKDLMKKYKI